MHRFFSDEIKENTIFFSKEDAHHITHSLRLKQGEEVTVVDNRQKEYTCKIIFNNSEVCANIEAIKESENEPNISVTLFQCLPKSDKLETIIQKSVELGVDEITPVLSSRSVVRISKKDFEKKLVRLNKIALEAAKQSMRAKVPKVTPLIEFKELNQALKDFHKIILFYEKSTESMKNIRFLQGEKIAVIIGAEGGFDENEVDFLIENQAISLSLGKRILRCETAPIAALSLIMYETNNM